MCRLSGSGVSVGLFVLTLIRAPQGVTATCDITLSACFTNPQSHSEIFISNGFQWFRFQTRVIMVSKP